MSDKKHFVGSGWLTEFENGGSILNLSLKLEELKKIPVNKYGDVQVSVHSRKEPDSKSKATHYVTENTFKKKDKSNDEQQDIGF